MEDNDMSQTRQLGSALLALLIALPLISAGMTLGSTIIWGGGLLLLLIGTIVPIYSRVHRGDSCSEKSLHCYWGRLFKSKNADS